jgi:hypothetical protein
MESAGSPVPFLAHQDLNCVVRWHNQRKLRSTTFRRCRYGKWIHDVFKIPCFEDIDIGPTQFSSRANNNRTRSSRLQSQPKSAKSTFHLTFACFLNTVVLSVCVSMRWGWLDSVLLWMKLCQCVTAKSTALIKAAKRYETR